LLTSELKSLVDAGLGATSVLTNLHHWRIVPLMEREFLIFKMTEEADPTALARSRLLHERLPQEYAATRTRRTINLRSVPHGRDDLWSFIMLPDALAVSGLPLRVRSLAMHWCGLNGCF
jgi:hypothetical protein